MDQSDNGACSSTWSQSERDRQDNEAVRNAWLSLTGMVPIAIEQRVSRGEVFYSALDLAEYVIGPHRLAGWSVSFTTDGGPYSAKLVLQRPRNETLDEIAASHPTSLAIAFVSVINKWMDGDRNDS